MVYTFPTKSFYNSLENQTVVQKPFTSSFDQNLGACETTESNVFDRLGNNNMVLQSVHKLCYATSVLKAAKVIPIKEVTSYLFLVSQITIISWVILIVEKYDILLMTDIT